jgi:spore coat protein U-like protein
VIIMLSKRHIAAAVLMTLTGVGSVELADANTTGTFLVSVTIQAACTLVTNPLNFGTVTAGTSNVVQNNAALQVTCPTGQAYSVGLLTTNTGGANGTGNLKNGATNIGYQLFSNTGYTTVWGNTQGTNTVAGTGSGAIQTLTVYGQIPAGNILAADGAGSYTDNVTVTVFY